MKQSTLDALASAIYLARRQVQSAGLTDDDEHIRASGLYDAWTAGKYEVGNIRNANGQTWECFQAHDNEEHPDVTPENSAWYTFWRPLHGKTPETARPWLKPQHGTTDIYHIGECMIYTDGKVYQCQRDTDFSPEEYAADWGLVE